MREFGFGSVVLSTAGHDKGSFFLVIDVQDEYLILADGRLRTVEHPKQKKIKHVQTQNYRCERLLEAKEASRRITNEMIKFELKEYQRKIQGGLYV